jgi:ankyrin repeat protein
MLTSILKQVYKNVHYKSKQLHIKSLYLCNNVSKIRFSNVSKIKFHIISGIRFYGTDAQLKYIFIKSQISQISVYDGKTNELMTAIHTHNYEKAKLMIKNNIVDVNGHNIQENTILTDAAERGDCEAIEFIINTLKANPHASCDCPYHKTALHYASENGHKDAVQMLLKLGANPNVKDSRNYKPIDVAKTNDIVLLLKEHETKNVLDFKKNYLR